MSYFTNIQNVTNSWYSTLWFVLDNPKILEIILNITLQVICTFQTRICFYCMITLRHSKLVFEKKWNIFWIGADGFFSCLKLFFASVVVAFLSRMIVHGFYDLNVFLQFVATLVFALYCSTARFAILWCSVYFFGHLKIRTLGFQADVKNFRNLFGTLWSFLRLPDSFPQMTLRRFHFPLWQYLARDEFYSLFSEEEIV